MEISCMIDQYLFRITWRITMHYEEKNNDWYHRLEQQKQMEMDDKEEDGNQSPTIDQEV